MRNDQRRGCCKRKFTDRDIQYINSWSFMGAIYCISHWFEMLLRQLYPFSMVSSAEV